MAHGYTDADDRGTPLEWTETDELWGLVGNGGVLSTVGSLVLEPTGPRSIRLLAFPGASRQELEEVRRLDRRSTEILDGVAAGDFGPFARALEDSSSLGTYRGYVADWWSELEAAGGGRDDVAVVGTVPVWWNQGDDRLATLVRAVGEGREEFFRFHWRDGRIVGLGGGAVREPATTLFALNPGGGFVGYHLGIREPVRLTFGRDHRGRIVTLRLETRADTVVAGRMSRVPPGAPRPGVRG